MTKIASLPSEPVIVPRIRTYNYPQNRVTDHRIGLSLNKLDRIMNGELDDVIDALVLYDQTKALEELQNG